MSESESAVIKRINRKLAPEGLKLKTRRASMSRWLDRCHLVVDVGTNLEFRVLDIDLETYEQELDKYGVRCALCGPENLDDVREQLIRDGQFKTSNISPHDDTRPPAHIRWRRLQAVINAR